METDRAKIAGTSRGTTHQALKGRPSRAGEPLRRLAAPLLAHGLLLGGCLGGVEDEMLESGGVGSGSPGGASENPAAPDDSATLCPTIGHSRQSFRVLFEDPITESGDYRVEVAFERMDGSRADPFCTREAALPLAVSGEAGGEVGIAVPDSSRTSCGFGRREDEGGQRLSGVVFEPAGEWDSVSVEVPSGSTVLNATVLHASTITREDFAPSADYIPSEGPCPGPPPTLYHTVELAQ